VGKGNTGKKNVLAREGKGMGKKLNEVGDQTEGELKEFEWDFFSWEREKRKAKEHF